MLDLEGGGIRARLTHDSFVAMLSTALATLGWFDAGRQHRPISIIDEPVDWNEPVEPNLICVTTQDSETEEVELGSGLISVVVPYMIDIYAESESLGLDLSGDIFDIARGRHPAAGRTWPTFDILDFRADPAEQIGQGRIGDLQKSRTPMRVERPWLQNWFVLSARVTDVYAMMAPQLDSPYLYPGPDTYPGPDVFPGGPP